MKLLLDTHIWLWSLMETKNLSRRVLRELNNAADRLLAATANVFGLTLVTSDARLIEAENVSILANR